MNICYAIIRFLWSKKKLILPLIFLNVMGCDDDSLLILPGYAYGDFVYLSASETEKVERLLVNKGDFVVEGQELVKMESFTVENTLQRAEKSYQAELALLRNMQSGERPAELDVIRSQLEQAQSAASVAKSQLKRYQQLYHSRNISAAEWENFREDYRQKRAQVDELTHQLEAKQLPARQEEIHRQMAQANAAKLQRDKAEWDLRQRVIVAPQAAQVYDIIYRPGERPVAGRPVISLLPNGNVKIRFFIPEKRLGMVKTGMKVRLYFDGYPAFVPGSINYISPQAEYTPPVIYSTRRREKLMFMAEALPVKEQASRIKPGQPVKVEMVVDDAILH